MPLKGTRMGLPVAKQRHAMCGPCNRTLVALVFTCLCGGCASHPARPAQAAPAHALSDKDLDEALRDAAKQEERNERKRLDPCQRPDLDEVPVIDDTREFLEEELCGAALWIDGLFGERGNEEAARRTHGFVELSNYYSEFEGYDSRARMRVQVDLPTMENRLSAFIGRENDDDFVRGRSEAFELRSQFPTLDDENEWLAGLGYSLPGRKRLETNFRVGVRGLAHPKVFVQSRLRYNVYADNDDIAYVSTTPFWNNHDGYGITQSFDYSHVITRSRLLRWYSVGTVSQESRGLNWRNSLIHYQNLLHKRGLAYEAFVRGETDEPEPLYEYGGRVLFRHPFLKRRLYAEWALGYSWPRTDPAAERQGAANVGLGLEMPFGTQR